MGTDTPITQVQEQQDSPPKAPETDPFHLDRPARPLWSRLASLFAPTPATSPIARWPILLELGLLGLVVFSYCSRFLDMNPTLILPGNESELFQSLDWIFRQSILQNGGIPQWNPYYYTGLPLVADPMFHSFNPLVSLPVLAFGVVNGSKIAVCLSFLVGAVGMWWLAARLGLGWVARVWMALLFAFSGQPTARFFQGQYLFIYGWAWIPWATGSLLALYQTRRKLYCALAALSLGMLFFSGNAYYPYYMVFVAAVLFLVFWIRRKPRFPYLRPDHQTFFLFAVTGTLALGLAAVQLLPTLQLWPAIHKSENLAGSHTPAQVFLDFVSKDTQRPDAYAELPAREEFFAYTGLWPFLPLLFLPLAFLRRDRKVLLFFLLLLGFTLAWIDLRDMPWRTAIQSIHLFSQFRYPIRMIVFTELAILGLAGLSLDTLWTWAIQVIQVRPTQARASWKRAAAYLTGGVILALTAASIWDVYSNNKTLTGLQETDPIVETTFAWVKDNIPSIDYVRRNPNNTGFLGAMANTIRLLEPWYHYNDIRAADTPVNQRRVTASPNVLVQPVTDAQPPIPTDALSIATIQGDGIYRLTDSLPYAFTVPITRLSGAPSGAPLTADEVTAQTAYAPAPERIETIVNAAPDTTLVVLTTAYPGWRATVDGQPQTVTPVDGYLAVPARPGVHKYEFVFASPAVAAGLWISLVSTGLLATLVVTDTRHVWRPAARSLRSWASSHPIKRGFAQLSEEPLSAKLTWLKDRTLTLDARLFGLTLATYLVSRFWALDRFPIYFFCDEAIQTMLASDLIRDHFTNNAGQLLPTYFKNFDKFNLSFSVYLQVLPTLLFGRSIWITRGISVLVTGLGVIAVCLTLRNVFKTRYWWSAGLFLSITPAWFLHSRTAFETVLMVSFYAAFLYCYLIYRYRSPRHLYAAIVFGALSFYSYSPGQVIVVLSGVLFLLLDARYHWQQRKTALRALGVLLVCALPYLRFNLQNPGETMRNLQVLGSYWLEPVPWLEKLQHYWKNYLYGLSPAYWYLPNDHDLERHLMKGYGHILLWTAPLALLGLATSLRNLRSPAHRAILAALLAAPAGAALVDIGITRTLVLVVPVALLTALGLGGCLSWLEKNGVRQKTLAPAAFVVLAAVNFYMLSDAVRNGPTWFQNYDLGGMQYGGEPLFSSVNTYQKYHPAAKLRVSPNWANNTDAIARFFLPEGTSTLIDSIDSFQYAYQPLDPETVFVMTPEEYHQVTASPKFTQVSVEQTLAYPNGQPGFYFVRLQYAENVQEIFAAETAARKVLQEEDIMISGIPVHIRYSALDMGQISDVFDGDPNSVARTTEANPLTLDLAFPAPQPVQKVAVRIGSAATRLTAQVQELEDGPIQTFQTEVAEDHNFRDILLDFGKPLQVSQLVLQIESVHETEPAHVHVWEVILK